MTREISGKRLGALVARYRNAQNRSARHVAREAGIDIATMTRLEKGQYAQPSLETVKGLHRALGIPMFELVSAMDMFTPYELVHMANTALSNGFLLAGEAANLRAEYLTHLIEGHGLGDISELNESGEPGGRGTATSIS